MPIPKHNKHDREKANLKKSFVTMMKEGKNLIFTLF